MTIETQYDRDRAALEAKQAHERNRLDHEHTIIGSLPPAVDAISRMIHLNQLYDRSGSVHFKYERYESLRAKGTRDVLLEDIEALARWALPVPAAVYRDGCVGVRSLENAHEQGAKDEALGRAPKVTPIAPVWYVIHPSQWDQEATIHWIGDTPAGRLEMVCVFPLYGWTAHALGVLQVKYDHYRDGEIKALRSNTFTPSLSHLGACKTQQIRYGAGDHKTPGHHVVYFEVVDGNLEAPSAQPADLAYTLIDRRDGVTE